MLNTFEKMQTYNMFVYVGSNVPYEVYREGLERAFGLS